MKNVLRAGRRQRGTDEPNLGLDVERDQAVRHQVVDGLKPFLAHKVLSVMVEAEIPGLVAEPGGSVSGEDVKRLGIRTSFDFSFSFSGDFLPFLAS